MDKSVGSFSPVWLRRSLLGRVAALGAPWAAAMVACGPSQPAADLKAPTNQEVLGKAQCTDGQATTTPDLMAWDSESRLNLSRLRNAGIVAVRYQAHGCDVHMELLSNCIAQGTYQFTPYVSKESKVAHDESELFAKLPLGAASLSGKVAGNQSVRTDYLLVGEHALPPDATFKRADFQGADCARATHVISAVYVGGFALVTGNEREIDAAVTVFGAGGGAGQTASVERIASEGDPDACDRAQKTHTPDDACNVPLRVGLLPISDVVIAPDPTPTADSSDGGSPGDATVAEAPSRPVSPVWTPGAPTAPSGPTFVLFGNRGGIRPASQLSRRGVGPTELRLLHAERERSFTGPVRPPTRASDVAGSSAAADPVVHHPADARLPAPAGANVRALRHGSSRSDSPTAPRARPPGPGRARASSAPRGGARVSAHRANPLSREVRCRMSMTPEGNPLHATERL